MSEDNLLSVRYYKDAAHILRRRLHLEMEVAALLVESGDKLAGVLLDLKVVEISSDLEHN